VSLSKRNNVRGAHRAPDRVNLWFFCVLCLLPILARVAVAAPAVFSFGGRSDYPIDNVTAIAVGNFNGDSRADIAAIGMDADGNPTVTLLFGQANGTFRVQSSALSVAGAVLPFDAIAAGNFRNNDALDDLALLVPDINSLQDRLQLFTNVGGTPQQVAFQALPGVSLCGNPDDCDGPTAINTLDFNGDGLTDFAIPTGSGSVALFLHSGNNFISQPLLLTGRDPTAGTAGGCTPR
jgi:hypothetical protein